MADWKGETGSVPGSTERNATTFAKGIPKRGAKAVTIDIAIGVARGNAVGTAISITVAIAITITAGITTGIIMAIARNKYSNDLQEQILQQISSSPDDKDMHRNHCVNCNDNRGMNCY